MKEIDFQLYLNKVLELLQEYVPKIIIGAIVLWIGFKLVKWFSQRIKRLIEQAGLSIELSSFVSGLLDIVMKVGLILVVASYFGFKASSLLAFVAAAGFGVGLALQGSLGNFAAGVLILVFKPYKVGDYIEVLEKFGKVKDIQIFNTILESPGNKTHVIPNGKIMDDVVTNISTRGNIRLEMEVTMPYSEDFGKVSKVIMDVLDAHPKVLKTPKPEVGILQYDSHNILIGVRPYVLPDEYWDVRFEVLAQIKRAFHEHKIQVAYSEGVEIGSIGA